MSLDVRAITPSETADWMRAVGTGFLTASAGAPDEELVADRFADADLSRTQGAFDAGRCVGTFRSFAQELTVVGGATVAADAISGVTVTPTHRRRGLLSRMMATDLAAAKERGEPVASLIAAEYPIYGRFGFGPAAWSAEWEVSVNRAGLDPRRSGQPAGGGRIEMVDGADVPARPAPRCMERSRPGSPASSPAASAGGGSARASRPARTTRSGPSPSMCCTAPPTAWSTA